jgi:nucleoside-diphosphate-sugar epimerase
MKILITGGSGFIGKYMVNKLSKHHQVISPSSEQLNLLDRNSVKMFLTKEYFDAVIHAAVVGRENVHSMDRNILLKNISMFTNLYENHDHYAKFINLGSGAEFGLDNSIDNAHEDDIYFRFPFESYGLAKNIITRIIRTTPNFFNLRIFSCFDSSESDKRLLKKFNQSLITNTDFVIKDRWLDVISLEDVFIVIEAVLNNKVFDNDLNVVYQEKYKISEILEIYCKINNITNYEISITQVDSKNYTGNGSRLSNYKLNMQGLYSALSRYYIESFKK